MVKLNLYFFVFIFSLNVPKDRVRPDPNPQIHHFYHHIRKELILISKPNIYFKGGARAVVCLGVMFMSAVLTELLWLSTFLVGSVVSTRRYHDRIGC